MSEAADKKRLDAISITIDGELSAWLTETAGTTDSLEEEASMVAGAIAGLCRFLWANRRQMTTPEIIADYLRSSAIHFLEQARDAEIGGHA